MSWWCAALLKAKAPLAATGHGASEEGPGGGRPGTQLAYSICVRFSRSKRGRGARETTSQKHQLHIRDEPGQRGAKHND